MAKDSEFLNSYKVQLLLSTALAVVLIALRVEKNPLILALIILGALLGTFLLELDYIIHAYFVEPDSDFSRTLCAFIKHFDLVNALKYVYYNSGSVKDKTLNSVQFQVVLAPLAIFVLSSTTSEFFKAFVLGAFLNSMYRLAEMYFHDKISEWFWAVKNKPSKRTFYIYSSALVLVFLFCLSIF